jgi:hypothetical protein
LLGIAAQKVTGEPLARMMARWRPYPRNDVVMHIPDWNDINRLLSTARQLCGRDNDSRSTRKVERDAAVISILRVYQLIYMTPPTVKTVRPFIEKIERFYSGILPRKGFGVLRSAKVLQGLIDAAR